MQTVLYKFIFCWKNVPTGPLSTQELVFETHRLVFAAGLKQTCILPPPHHLFKCRTLYLLLNMMLASKWLHYYVSFMHIKNDVKQLHFWGFRPLLNKIHWCFFPYLVRKTMCVVLKTKRFLCNRKKWEQYTGDSFWLLTRRNKTLHNLLSFTLFSKETDLNS